MIVKIRNVLITLIAVSFIAVVFSAFPYIEGVTEPVYPFILKRLEPFYIRSYVWELCDHINHLILLFVVYKLGCKISKEWSIYLVWFPVFELFLLIEYMLNRNEPFYSIQLFGHVSTIGLSHLFIPMKIIIVCTYLYNQKR